MRHSGVEQKKHHSLVARGIGSVNKINYQTNMNVSNDKKGGIALRNHFVNLDQAYDRLSHKGLLSEVPLFKESI